MTRKSDTLIHSWVMGKGVATCWPSADYNSNQNGGGGRAVSLQPSLLVQGDMGMRKPHFLFAVYASAERCRPATMVGTEGKQPKSQHVVIFQITETKQLPFLRRIIWDMEETQILKSCRVENPEGKEKTPLNEFKLRGMVSLVKRIPKEKICLRGKRQ